jgi:uncharacterized membrane protein YkoI
VTTPFLVSVLMDMNRRRFVCGFLLIADSSQAHPASASEDDGDDDDRDEDDESQGGASSAVDDGEISLLSFIIRIALAHTPGKVIDVKLRHKDAAYIYRIKILTRNGRKRELHINARSRQILRVKS